MLENKKTKFSFFNRIKQTFLIFIYSLFFIDRKNKTNFFFLQSILGLFNFLLCIIIVLNFIIFKKDLLPYNLLYIFYGFFLLIYILISSYFYYYFRYAFINKEKYYFFSSFFLAPIGLNLFVSIFFYFKSGFNIKQKNQENLKTSSNNLFFVIEKGKKTNFFLFQSFIALFNLILFSLIMIIYFLFRNEITSYKAVSVYISYGFFILVYILFSSYFYHHYLKHILNYKQRKYFWFSIFLAPTGLNFFLSTYFYSKVSVVYDAKQKEQSLESPKQILQLSLADIKSKKNVYILQSFIGLFNLVLFLAIIFIFTIFKDSINIYWSTIIYVLSGLFLFFYILFSSYFYHFFNSLFINNEKKYFLWSIFLAPVGLNFFISMYLYINKNIKLDKSKLGLSNPALSYKDKKNAKNILISELNVGFFNLVSFLGLVVIYIFFKNDWFYYIPIIVYILFGFFLLFYLFSSLYFYLFYFKYIFNTKEKLYFWISFFLTPLGINLFVLIYFYFKLRFQTGKNQNTQMNILMLNESKTSFIKSLLIMNRTNRANVFVFQSIIGLFNLLALFSILIMYIIFKNDLFDYKMLIIYSIYLFYIILNAIFSLFFYSKLKLLLTKNEKKYFLWSIFLALTGLNFFTSIYFYFQSGISIQQKAKALWIINKNRLDEIIQIDNVKNNLNKNHLSKIKTLLTIAKNNVESKDNINEYILKLLLSNNIKWHIKIDNKKIVELAKTL